MADRSALQINTWLKFETLDCCQCGVTFAVAAALRGNWERDKTSFYCPNGHVQSYTESEADRLRRQLDKAMRDAEWQKSRALSLDGQLAKERKATARLKKRVQCGVCPHCQRTFKALAAHMKSKHSELLKSGQERAGL